MRSARCWVASQSVALRRMSSMRCSRDNARATCLPDCRIRCTNRRLLVFWPLPRLYVCLLAVEFGVQRRDTAPQPICHPERSEAPGLEVPLRLIIAPPLAQVPRYARDDSKIRASALTGSSHLATPPVLFGRPPEPLSSRRMPPGPRSGCPTRLNRDFATQVALHLFLDPSR